MNKSKPSKNSWGIATVIGGMAAVLIVAATVFYQPAVNRVVAKGDSVVAADSRAALVYYQAADAISPASVALVTKEIKVLDRLGEFELAAKQINRLQHITPEIELVRAKIALERGVDVEHNLSIVFSDSKGLKTLMVINTNQTALAAELLARGLVRSAERIIVAIPAANRSALDNLILAKSLIRQSDNTGAKSALEASLKLDISNLQTHKLYKSVIEQLGADTTKEQQIINQLESGKI